LLDGDSNVGSAPRGQLKKRNFTYANEGL